MGIYGFVCFLNFTVFVFKDTLNIFGGGGGAGAGGGAETEK